MKNLQRLFLFCLIMSLAGVSVNAADIRKGIEVYNVNCAICHADDGRGTVADAPDFRFGDKLIQADVSLFRSISSGKGMMPAFRAMLTEQDIFDVIGYLRTLQQ